MDSKIGPKGPRPELLNGKPLTTFLTEVITSVPEEKRDLKLFYGPVMPTSVKERLTQHEQQLGLPSINDERIDFLSDSIVDLFGEDWGVLVLTEPEAKTGWSIYRTIDGDQLHVVGTVKPKVTLGSQANLQRVLLNHRTLRRLLPFLQHDYSDLAKDLIENADKRLGKAREGLVDGYGKDWLPLLALYEVFNGMDDQQDALALLDEWARYYAVMSFKTTDAQNYIAMAAFTAATTGDRETWLTMKILNPDTSSDPAKAQRHRDTIAQLTDAISTDSMAPLYRRNARIMARITILQHLQGASDFTEIHRRLGECVLMSILGITPDDSAFEHVQKIPTDDIHELVALSSHLLYNENIDN